MRFKLVAFPVLAVSILSVAVSAFSQVVPSYERKSGWPFTVGVGPVSYDVDLGHGRMYGFAGWFDIYPGKLPSILHGHLGAEGELREIRFGASSSQPNVRYDTAAMGLIYTWNRLKNIRPYAKCMIGDGSVDFPRLGPTYSHDTRTFTAPGVDRVPGQTGYLGTRRLRIPEMAELGGIRKPEAAGVHTRCQL